MHEDELKNYTFCVKKRGVIFSTATMCHILKHKVVQVKIIARDRFKLMSELNLLNVVFHDLFKLSYSRV